MFRNKSAFLAVAVLAGLGFVASAQGALITNLNQVGGGVDTGVNLLDGGFAEGIEAFTDRPHVLVNVPPELVGSDYVQLENDNKTDANFALEVTLGRLAALYVILDNRVGDGDENTPAVPLPWMTNGSIGVANFIDTQVDIDIDENADGSVDQAYSVFITLAEAGTYTFGAQDDGGSRNMYGIIASTTIVPEPTTIGLLIVGLAGVMLRRHRRRA